MGETAERVGITLVGEAGSKTPPNDGFNNSFILTDEYPPGPYGVYLFAVVHVSGTQPNSRRIYIKSVTGLGLVWVQKKTMRRNSVNLVDGVTEVWMAVGIPRGGPIFVEFWTQAFGTDFPPGHFSQAGWGLHRLRNVPSFDVDDIIVQSDYLSAGNPVLVTTMVNPISDPRNLVFWATHEVINGLWPLEQLWAAGGGAAYFTNGLRSASWTGFGNVNNIIGLEIGYHDQPWLRQKQRDDI